MTTLRDHRVTDNGGSTAVVEGSSGVREVSPARGPTLANLGLPQVGRDLIGGDSLNITAGRTLFFEVGSEGHRMDYIERILRALAERRFERGVVFVLSPDFEGKLPDSLVSKAKATNSVDFVYLSDEETAKCQEGGGTMRRLAATSVFRQYLRDTEAAFGFVNYFDFILTGLAFPRLSKTSAPVSGILFRPSVHYESLGRGSTRSRSVWGRLQHRAKLRGEDFVYRRTLNNPNVASVLSLDPIFPEYARATHERGDKVIMLPEPYSGLFQRAEPRQDPERTTFLMIGSITQRKGIYETLAAFGGLSSAEAARARLVVAGRIQAQTADRFAQAVVELESFCPNLDIVVRDEFLTDEEFGSLVNDCHVVLAPYREHVGSSGILAWAADYQRPVITQRYGVVGEIVDRYSLGLTCDPSNTHEFTGCIRRAIEQGPEALAAPSGMIEFDEQNNPEGFVQGILKASGLVEPPG